MQSYRRRLFLIAAGALFGATLQAFAQPAGQRIYVVGLLVPNRLQAQNEFTAFTDTLRQLGYRDGENLRLVTREAAGKLDRLPALAREIVDARVDVIVAWNTPGARAAIDATRDIPIVMTSVGDPVGSGFVKSLARPGGNVTGISNLVAELGSKRMEILREAIPSGRRFAVLFNPGDPITRPQIGDLENLAKNKRLEVRFFPVRNPDELADTFAQVMAWKAHAALWLLGQHQLFQSATVELAARHKLPVMVGNVGDVSSGGLISYSNNFSEVHKRTAAQVDLILKGKRPRDMPVEQSTRFELSVNLKTAKALGFTFPPALLLRADRVIE
jgi:putative ABC transport system substrate-binding protein